MTIELRASVGDNQTNHPQDVALVQFLLGAQNPVNIDGQWGPQTSAAVAAFQMNQFGFTDGIVDPGDITFNRLRGSAGTGNFDPIAKQVVLRSTGENIPDAPPDPLDTRPTADGQGVVTTWVDVPGGGLRIYSHPVFGTWEVRGAILDAYAAAGDDAGAFGNPISGERNLSPGPGRVSWFEKGRIEFSQATGVTTPIPLAP